MKEKIDVYGQQQQIAADGCKTMTKDHHTFIEAIYAK